jgi:hypothetical protein
MLTREDDGEDELSKEQKERKRQANIYGKGESILGEAEYHIWRPMPGITAGPSSSPWGQVRPMGAVSRQAKSRANSISSVHW